MDLGHDILAIMQDGYAFGRAQRDVQHGAFFRDGDVSPRNTASMRSHRPDCSASRSRSRIVSSVMRFLE